MLALALRSAGRLRPLFPTVPTGERPSLTVIVTDIELLSL